MLRLVLKEGDPGDASDLEVKEVTSFEIKDAEKGEVEAIVATLGVVDRDSDVITMDAIKSGAKVKMSGYGHDAVWGETPVGKGQIVIEGAKAIFKGRLFMSTVRGKEIFSVLKEMGSEQEWSFGFRVKGSEVPDEDWTKKGARRILTKIEAFEVSPVIMGAGIGTRTVAVKSDDPPTSGRRPIPGSSDPPEPTDEEKATAEKKAADEAAAVEAKRLADERAAAEIKRAASDEALRFERTRRKYPLAS